MKAQHHSLYGTISSDWKRENGTFTWNVVVPPNTTATVHLPIADETKVRESGKTVTDSKGVQFLRKEAGRSIFQIGSGSYKFVGPLAN